MFVANQQAGTLSVIDPEANKVIGEPIKAGTRPDGVVAGKGVVWLASAGSDAVQRFQAAGEIVPTAKVPVGDRPEAIRLGKQLVWVANVNDNTVNRIDRASPAIVGAPIGVGSKPTGDLRRPPLRVGGQQRRRHRHPHRVADDLGRRRVDAGDGVVAVVGHPDEAAADEDRRTAWSRRRSGCRRPPARRGRCG